jgi:hypothetical protein
MQLPFSHDAFLDVFGAYNSRLWPAALVLWVATASAGWGWLRGGMTRRLLFVLLAVHRAWSGCCSSSACAASGAWTTRLTAAIHSLRHHERCT